MRHDTNEAGTVSDSPPGTPCAPLPNGPHAGLHAGSVFGLEHTLPGALADKLHNAACLITLPLMTLCVCAEIVMRYVFNRGLFWSQEACGIGLFVLVLCCQANCWQKDRHIRMDLIYNAAPAWFRKFADTLTIISGTVFFGVIGAQAVRDIPYQLAVNESTDEMHIPLWILGLVVITSCGLLLALLLRYAASLTGRGGRP